MCIIILDNANSNIEISEVAEFALLIISTITIISFVIWHAYVYYCDHRARRGM